MVRIPSLANVRRAQSNCTIISLFYYMTISLYYNCYIAITINFREFRGSFWGPFACVFSNPRVGNFLPFANVGG